MTDLYPKLAELLEVDTVQPTDVLEKFEMWDSLTVLSVLSLLDSEYGVNLTAQDLRATKTAGDLVELVSSRQSK